MYNLFHENILFVVKAISNVSLIEIIVNCLFFDLRDCEAQMNKYNNKYKYKNK